MQNTAKTNLPWYICLLQHPGNEVGFFYNAPKPTWGFLGSSSSEILSKIVFLTAG